MIEQETSVRNSRVLVRSVPHRSVLVLLGSDLIMLAGSLAVAVWFRYSLDDTLLWEKYVTLWPVLLLFPFAYALAGLYGVGIVPPEELRRLSYSTSLVFTVLGGATFVFKVEDQYSRGIFGLAWGLALVLVPLGRALARELWARKPWWGTAVVIFGAGKTGEAIVQTLVRNPGLGLKPTAVLDDDPVKHGKEIEGIRVVGGLERAEEFARQGVRYALIAMPGLPRERLLSVLEQHGAYFPNVILIPDLFELPSLWVTSRDLGGVLGLEVRKNLHLRRNRILKRVLDYLLGVPLFLFALPLIAFFALWIKAVSPGPALYVHERIGYKGRRIRVLKLRTMYPDADVRLREYLEGKPEAKIEWERYFKLKNDPRVLPGVGKFLRWSSLDELPQFLNVFKGEMSLVGPRPVTEEELTHYYGKTAELYLMVRPGLTGLWQVSGRNDVSYEGRVVLDRYYIQNWSIWLDIHILARTIWVVLIRKGAY